LHVLIPSPTGATSDGDAVARHQSMPNNLEAAGAPLGPTLARIAKQLLLSSVLVTFWVGWTAMQLVFFFMMEAIKFPFALVGSAFGLTGGRHYLVQRNGKTSWVSIWRY
jgi:hypothetical protein